MKKVKKKKKSKKLEGEKYIYKNKRQKAEIARRLILCI